MDGLVQATTSEADQTSEYRELILHPEHANGNHWTGRKFHWYLTRHCQLEAGYSTLIRWIHDERFRLKIPRPWPVNQDECGIEGDPRPPD